MPLALLILNLCACTIPLSVKPEIDATLSEPCAPLPEINLVIGQDIRTAWLESRAADVKVHNECMAKHQGVLDAVR
jgi:hypothetical protein